MTQEKRKIKLITATAVIALCAFATPASAYIEYDYGHANSNTAAIQSTFSSGLSASTASIIEALQLSTGQISGNLKQQMAAEANMNALKDARANQIEINRVTNQAVIGATSGASVCASITSAIASSGMDAQTAAWREAIQQELVNADKGSSGKSKVALDKERRVAYCRYSADQSDIDNGTCTKDSVVKLNVGAGRSLNANVLMNPSNPTASGGSVDTHQTLSEEDGVASLLFVMNAFGSSPLGALPPDAAKTEQGKNLVAARNASIARKSVATSIAAEYKANREPLDISVVNNGVSGDNAEISLTKWANSMASKVLGYKNVGTDGANDVYFPNGVSKTAWLELQAKSWFLNPEWVALTTSNTNASQTLKDIAVMQSFEIFQNNEIYKKMETIEMGLATIIAGTEDQNRKRNGL